MSDPKAPKSTLAQRNVAPDRARSQAADKDRRRTQFMRGMNNMKILAEGGTLPPPPARGGR